MAQIHALTPEGRLPSTAVQQVHELVPHPIEDVPTSTDWVRAEVDGEGRIAQAIDSQGRTWLIPHPDIDGLLDPAVARQIREVDAPDWAWAVADESGQVAFGVRADGTAYPSGGGAVAEPYDVILLVGQSNMQGRGAPGITRDNEGVDQYPADGQPDEGQIVPAVEPLQHPGPSFADRPNSLAIPFARAYRDAHPSRRVLLVPAAWGGTGFDDTGETWDWTRADDATNLARRAVNQTKAALAAAGPGARLAGIVWHQGEGDSAISAEYATWLDGLIDYLRGELGDAPVAVGQMSPDRTIGNADALVIDHAHQQTPARVLGSAFAPTPYGLHNPGDSTHLSTRALDIIGPLLAEAIDRAAYNLAGVGPVGPENVTTHRAGDTVTVSWDAAWCRVTDYLVEWREPGGTWGSATVDHSPALGTSATITVPAAIEVRVTTANETGTATPVTAYAAGAAGGGSAMAAITPTSDWRTDVDTTVEAHRSGDVVTITAWRLSVNDGVTGDVEAYTVPAGFRPLGMYDGSTVDSRGAAVRLDVNGVATVTDPSGPVAHHTFTYITADPFPA